MRLLPRKCQRVTQTAGKLVYDQLIYIRINDCIGSPVAQSKSQELKHLNYCGVHSDV